MVLRFFKYPYFAIIGGTFALKYGSHIIGDKLCVISKNTHGFK